MTDQTGLLAIFDHDGVLADTLALHQEAWVNLGRQEGLPITEAFVLETFGMTNPAIFRRLLGDQISLEQIKRFGDLKEAQYRAAARSKIELVDGVVPLITQLRTRGFKTAVGTSGPRANVLVTLEKGGLVDSFDTIVALEDVERGKPDPEVFLKASRFLQKPPSATAVFEDAVVGIRAAKAAGMYAVGLTTTTDGVTLRQAGADEVVESFLDYPIDTLIETLQTRTI